MGAYAVAGFLPMLSAMFITKTVPLQPLHVGKHYCIFSDTWSISQSFCEFHCD